MINQGTVEPSMHSMEFRIDRLNNIVERFRSELDRLGLSSLEFYSPNDPEEIQEIASEFSCDPSPGHLRSATNEERVRDSTRVIKQKKLNSRKSSLGDFLLNLQDKIMITKSNVDTLAKKIMNGLSPNVDSPIKFASPLYQDFRNQVDEIQIEIRRLRSGSIDSYLLRKDEETAKTNSDWELSNLRRKLRDLTCENGILREEVLRLRKENQELRNENDVLLEENAVYYEKMKEIGNRKTGKPEMRKTLCEEREDEGIIEGFMSGNEILPLFFSLLID